MLLWSYRDIEDESRESAANHGGNQEVEDTITWEANCSPDFVRHSRHRGPAHLEAASVFLLSSTMTKKYCSWGEFLLGTCFNCECLGTICDAFKHGNKCQVFKVKTLMKQQVKSFYHKSLSLIYNVQLFRREDLLVESQYFTGKYTVRCDHTTR